MMVRFFLRRATTHKNDQEKTREHTREERQARGSTHRIVCRHQAPLTECNDRARLTKTFVQTSSAEDTQRDDIEEREK